MNMGNLFTKSVKPGDFSFINDDMWRRSLSNIYISITKLNLWDWLKSFDPPINKGFMFSNHINLKKIENELDYNDPANGHSGASWGICMRNMSHIAKYGWDAWSLNQINAQKEDDAKRKKEKKTDLIPKVPPSSPLTPTLKIKIGKQPSHSEICNAMELSGLVQTCGMDDLNKDAWDTLKNEGTAAAVTHMFKHPTEKDQHGNPRQMSYSEMRSFYG